MEDFSRKEEGKKKEYTEEEEDRRQGSLPGLCLAADDSIMFTGAWREEKAAAPADWKRNVVKGVVVQAASGRFSPFTPDLMKILDSSPFRYMRHPVQLSDQCWLPVCCWYIFRSYWWGFIWDLMLIIEDNIWSCLTCWNLDSRSFC